jgi:hypothetical protein
LIGAALGAALIAAALGCGRSQSAEFVLPPLPPGVESPAEYAFGDAVMTRDLRAWGPVFDALALEFDRATLRVIPLAMTADTDVAALRGHFDRELADRHGWRAVTPQIAARDAWAQGYESPDGRHVFMIVGRHPRPGDTLTPLTILTTLPGDP